MIEVLEGLKSTNILYSQNVNDLKSTIEKRYPHYSAEHKARLLASAVHKILDHNLSTFDKDLQPHIKSKLLQRVVKKDTFHITAYDVFEVCHSLEVSYEHVFEPLTDWINTSQSTSFSKEQVHTLASRPKATLPPTQNTSTLPDSNVIKDTKVIAPSPLLPDPLEPPASSYAVLRLLDSLNLRLAILLLTILMGIGGLIQLKSFNYYTAPVSTTDTTSIPDPTPVVDSEEIDLLVGPDNHLQEHLQYKEINEDILSDFLISRNSLLADKPYFDSIIAVAREFNINPLLMFAITGQEQGFVPKTHPRSTSIVNNPFNVYGSWEDFNTDIVDTSSIAARTILNLSKGCPADEDPIKWLNQKYAEDPNWHVGVSQILKQLENIVGN